MLRHVFSIGGVKLNQQKEKFDSCVDPATWVCVIKNNTYPSACVNNGFKFGELCDGGNGFETDPGALLKSPSSLSTAGSFH